VLGRRPRRGTGDQFLPGYSGLEEIGGGAFATVYRATEDETGRAVALKILKVDTLHSHLLETFHQEIHALGKVSDHPNIVTLYRPLTTPDGRPVLVLELCRQSLAQQVRTAGPLTAPAAVRVGIKVAGALETAHRHGFLHRDMKPQNILVTQFGEPALADFGVAALQASAQATAGVFGFTTLHAAPEMLEGHRLSPATDIYGLASTMYQLLTGLAPFAAFDQEAPASVILRILRDPVRPLRSEGLPIALSDLLEAALAKDPAGRPATAAGFAAALQSIEVAAGWTPTSYSAWGAEVPGPAERAARSIPSAPSVPSTGSTPTAGEVPVEGRAGLPPTGLYSEPPSTRVGDVSPLPLVDPGAVGEAQRLVPPEPPLSRRGPAVAPPPPPGRSVVAPTEAGRGHAVRPVATPLAPLEPLPPLERPVFVDPGEGPDPASADPHHRRDGVYEQTMQAGRLFGRRTPPDGPVDEPAPGETGRLVRALAIGGVVLAAVVVVVALLLLLGLM